MRAGTVVVVGVNVVVVDVHPCEKRGPRRAAHRSCDVRVPNFGPLIANRTQRPRHEIQRTQLDVLIVRQNQNYVRFAFPGRRRVVQNFPVSALLLREHVPLQPTRDQHQPQKNTEPPQHVSDKYSLKRTFSTPTTRQPFLEFNSKDHLEKKRERTN